MLFAKDERKVGSFLTFSKLKIISAILVITAILSVFVWFSQPSNPSVKVGIFYYLWYGAPDSDGWNASKFVDFPLIGNYSSSNSTVIGEQLHEIKGLGVDFVVLSWWGFYDNYGKFTDNSIKQVFSIAQESNSSLKFAVMVEPFNKNGSAYNYTAIYKYIYDEFVSPFSSVYYNYSKPLICFFNDPNLTNSGIIPQNERFKIILVGQEPYVQWIYTDLNYYVKPTRNPYTMQTSVTPRYDDSHIEGRKPCIVDANLTEGIYGKEWENTIKLLKDGKIDTIMITSWNEYPERTAIEPHHDATSFNPDPWFLYNKTRDYIQEVRLLAK